MGSLYLSSILMPVPPCPSSSALRDPLRGSKLSLELCLTNVSVSDLFLSNLCPNGIVKIRINREVSRWFPSAPVSSQASYRAAWR